ncbi:hypothetical protein HZA87_05810, partial [Candidatus Uhrbacteria bacterium]|nr:hypothetical protein [Candidatus Uhrbacteria bacterium]
MALDVQTAPPEWEDEVREGPAAGMEETTHDLDLCRDLVLNTPLENADDAQVIADALKSGTATDPALRRNFLKLQWRMEEILWTSIIMDMCSEAIVKSSTAHNGPADGDKRTKETRDYFGSFLMRTPLREQMERITDYVNNLHADVGVRDETGVEPRITDEYLASFVFVLAAITEETRRFFREEMRLPEGMDMKKIDEAIFNVWYRGAGYAAGLQSIPANLEAHEQLYETYKKRSYGRMWQRPKARDQACVTARAFIPHLSAVAHCSEQEFADRLLKT